MTGSDRLHLDPVEPAHGGAVSLRGMLSDAALKAVLCTLNQVAHTNSSNSDLEKHMERARRIISTDLDLADGKADNMISKAVLARRIDRADPYYYKFNAAIYNNSAKALDVTTLAEILANHALQFAHYHEAPLGCAVAPKRVPPTAPADRPAGSQAVG